jgi:hypothetical protein
VKGLKESMTEQTDPIDHKMILHFEKKMALLAFKFLFSEQ